MDPALQQTHQAAYEEWRSIPPQTPVSYRQDDGMLRRTLTRSTVWRQGDGTPVINIYGVRGHVPVSRLTLVSSPLVEGLS